MKYIGVDIHKDCCVATILDEAGNKLGYVEFDNTRAEWLRFIHKYLKGKCKVAMEATTFSMAVYDLLEEHGIDVVVSNPSKTRIIAESSTKNDRLDSETIAQLLRTNYLPLSYIPPKEIRNIRMLLRHCKTLTHDIVQVKNRIHAIIHRNQLKHKFSDLFGKSGREFLRTVDLPQNERLQLDSLLRQLEFLEEEKEYMISKVAKLAEKNEDVKLLMTIPGISYYSAMIIVSEIADITRFKDYRKLASYAGLVPRLKESSNTRIFGHIKKDCNTMLKSILVEVTHVAVQYPGKIRAKYLRIKARRGNKIAIIAAARYLLSIIYCMLKNREPYRYQNPELTQNKIKKMERKVLLAKNDPSQNPRPSAIEDDRTTPLRARPQRLEV